MIFKPRCSSIYKIISEGRSKSQNLSQTAETYLHEWNIEQKYGIKKEVWSKEMQKGIDVEGDAIEFLSKYKDYFYFKNEKFYENDYITGTPDIITNDLIIDVKCPWSIFTFPNKKSKLNANYYWQIQGYMWITGIKRGVIAYVMMNTPLYLCRDDIDYTDYTKFADADRVKFYEVERDEKAIEKIKLKTEYCRQYLDNEL